MKIRSLLLVLVLCLLPSIALAAIEPAGGTGGVAINDDLYAAGSATITAEGGAVEGYRGEDREYPGHGGNAIVSNLNASEFAVFSAKGGDRFKVGQENNNSVKSGHGVVGNVTVQDSASVTVTGGKAGGDSKCASTIGRNGISSNVVVNGCRLIAAGGLALSGHTR